MTPPLLLSPLHPLPPAPLPFDKASEQAAAGRTTRLPGDGGELGGVQLETQRGRRGDGERGESAGRTGDARGHGEIIVAYNAGFVGDTGEGAQPVDVGDNTLCRRTLELNAVNDNPICWQVGAVVPGDGRGSMRVGQGHADRVVERDVQIFTGHRPLAADSC